MQLPTLHKVFDGRVNLYWVGEYPLFVRQEPGGWKICTAPSRPRTRQWLSAQRLDQQWFASRREALEVLGVLLDQPGAPSPEQLPKCQRQADGSLLVAGHVRVIRDGDGWLVHCPGLESVRLVGSRWRAVWMAAHLTDRPQDSVGEAADRKRELLDWMAMCGWSRSGPEAD